MRWHLAARALAELFHLLAVCHSFSPTMGGTMIRTDFGLILGFAAASFFFFKIGMPRMGALTAGASVFFAAGAVLHAMRVI